MTSRGRMHIEDPNSIKGHGDKKRTKEIQNIQIQRLLIQNITIYSTRDVLSIYIHLSAQLLPSGKESGADSKADVIALSTVKLYGHSQIVASSVVTPSQEKVRTLRGEDGGVMSGMGMAAAAEVASK